MGDKERMGLKRCRPAVRPAASARSVVKKGASCREHSALQALTVARRRSARRPGNAEVSIHVTAGSTLCVHG